MDPPSTHLRSTPPPSNSLSSNGFDQESGSDSTSRFPWDGAWLSGLGFASQFGPFQHSASTFSVEGSEMPFTSHLPSPSVNFSPWNAGLPVPPSVPRLSEPSAYLAGYASAVNVAAARRHSEPTFTTERGLTDGDMMTVSGLTGQTVPATLQPNHVLSWFQVQRDAVVVDGPRTFVPQIMYQPHSNGDRERYVSQATLHDPIIFKEQDSPEWGIPIQRLLSSESVQLVGGTEPAFPSESCGPTIGIRLNWPGYPPWHRQVSAKDYSRVRQVINKAKLATVVAKGVKKFMDTMSKKPMEMGSDGRWRIGPQHVRMEDLVLVSLHHVSQGSWQPHLRLRRTIGTNAVLGAYAQNHG